MTLSLEMTGSRNTKTLEAETDKEVWKRVNGGCAIFGSNKSGGLNIVDSMRTEMVNRATPALDVCENAGPNEIGRGWRGRRMKGIEAIGGVAKCKTIGNETV